MIVLFHRPARPDGKASPTWDVKGLEFSESTTALEVSVKAVIGANSKESFSLVVPVHLGKAYELYWHAGWKKAFFRDFAIVDPYRPSSGISSDEVTRFGRVHFEADRTLVYIRGRFADIVGAENVDLSDDETSAGAMAAYSSEASEIIAKARRKRAFLGDVDALDSVSYLEAQVDLLTKVVLGAGLAHDDDLEVLQAADAVGVWRSNTKEQLLRKMSEKQDFRERQLKYYEGE